MLLIIITIIIIIYLHCAKCLDAVIGGGLSAFESGRVEYLLLVSPRLDLLESFVYVERQLELERVDGERRLEQPGRRGAVVRRRVLRRTAAGHDQRDRLGLMVVVGVFTGASAESPRHRHRRRLDVPSPEPTTVKAKFHYASWFGASSELTPNMFGASSEPASVMEFGREPASSC